MSYENHFSKYGKDFQEKIFQSLLRDHQWATQMVEVMTHEYFELKYLQYLCDRFFGFYLKYKSFPTLSMLVSIIKDELTEGDDIILKGQVIEYLSRVKSSPDLGDLEYVKEKSLDFCKKQVLQQALEDSVKAIQGENYEAVLNIMKDAVSKGSGSSVGHDFFKDHEARFAKINRVCCPTGMHHLDAKDVFNGGLSRGEIGVIVAPTGVGIRYDSNLTGIPSSDVVDNKENVLSHYKENDYGRLIIKQYPTGSASIVTIRNHIEKLSMKDFIPSLVVIDYADIMRSTRQFDSLRHELKLVYEELRNLAMEMNIPVWTASQANREASNSEVVGLENMSEAYGKAMVADIVVSLSRKATEKATGSGRLFVAKNRAGKDGILFPVKIDTARSKIEIIDDPSQMSLVDIYDSHNTGTKDMLKSKWKEITASK